MSLSKPSPHLTSCTNSQYEVKKSTVQIRMASGRYRTCWLRRHWSYNPAGTCQVPGCNPPTPGTLLHVATGKCPGLKTATLGAVSLWTRFAASRPYLHPILHTLAKSSPDDFLSFLLNPTTHPLVICSSQQFGDKIIGELCYLTRTWLHTLHTARFVLSFRFRPPTVACSNPSLSRTFNLNLKCDDLLALNPWKIRFGCWI